MVGILGRVKNLLNLTELKTIYYSLVYPYLLYGIIFWGGVNRTDFVQIFRTQKKIIRIISGSDFLSHTSPLFFENSVLKLDDIRKLEMSKFIYNDINSLNSFEFQNRTLIHSHNTRNNTDLNLPRPRTNKFARSIFYEGISFYNSLDNSFKFSDSVFYFKSQVKNFLLSN